MIESIDISDPERRAQMKMLLHRGLNTWSEPPKWLVLLYDELHAEPVDIPVVSKAQR